METVHVVEVEGADYGEEDNSDVASDDERTITALGEQFFQECLSESTLSAVENEEMEATIEERCNCEVNHAIHDPVHFATQTLSSDIPVVKPSVYIPQIGPGDIFARKHEECLYKHELGIINTSKVLISIDLLESLFHGLCGKDGCILKRKVVSVLKGASATIRWHCQAGHIGEFRTSHQISNVMSNNLQLSAAILLSGNNFGKVSQLMNSAGISMFSKATFLRHQKKLCIPVVNEWWDWMQDVVQNDIGTRPCQIAGDGQCDSPGFSAKYMCYSLQEIASKYIVHMEFMDKRMCDRVSTRMEPVACTKSLQAVTKTLNVEEVVTDASRTIITEMSKDIFLTFSQLYSCGAELCQYSCIQLYENTNNVVAYVLHF